VHDLTLAVQRAASQTPTVLAGVISDLGVLLAPLDDSDDLEPARGLAEKVRQLSTQVYPGLEIVTAIGGAAELERAGHSYAEALRVMRMMRAMPDLGASVAWDDLGVFRALALLPADEIERAVIDRRVRALLADEVLAQTAETFLDLAGNVQETAARLFVHRTTLYQRLDRIAELFDLDLRRSGDHRLIAHLGFKLAHMTGS
jgi:DNA-binding PucR family transcriptional regulator